MSDDDSDRETYSIEVDPETVEAARRFDRGAGFVLTLMLATFLGTALWFELMGWW